MSELIKEAREYAAMASNNYINEIYASRISKTILALLDQIEAKDEDIDNIYGTLEWEWNWPVDEINKLSNLADSKKYTNKYKLMVDVVEAAEEHSKHRSLRHMYLMEKALEALNKEKK